MTVQYFGTEFEDQYEGDHPWYIVEFSDPKKPSAKKEIEALFMELFFAALFWDDVNPAVCTVECELDRSELAEWETHRNSFHKTVEKVHAAFPIASVRFLDAEE